MELVEKKSKEQIFLFLLFIVFISVRLAPYFILGQDSYITIHDNLDSNESWLKTLATGNYIFKINPDLKIDQIFAGELYRNSTYSCFSIVSVVYYFLTPYSAYFIILLIAIVLGFFGTYLFISKHILEESFFNKLVSATIAFSFIMLPFYTLYNCASVTGIPLILFLFFNLLKEKSININLIGLFLMGFASSIVFSGFFLCIVIFLIWLYFSFKIRKFNKNAFIGIVLFGISLILNDINVFIHILSNNGAPSHRTLFANNHNLSLSQALNFSRKHFLEGQYHSPSFNKFITIFCIVTIVISAFVNKNYNKILVFAFVTLGLFSLIYGLWRWEHFKISFLNSFNFSRFSIISSPLWYLLFAYSIKELFYTQKFAVAKWVITTTFLFMQFINVYANNKEYGINVKKIIARDKSHFNPKNVSYKQFYSTQLFDSIKKTINLPEKSYNVASVGLFPNIALYNGFSVIDSYQGEYPLSYKIKFRKIIAKELEKSKEIRDYFDGFGSRCYIYSSQLKKRYNIYKFEKMKRIDIELNSEILKELNCKFILSSVFIDNYKENNFEYIGSFTNEESPYEIKLYKVF